MTTTPLLRGDIVGDERATWDPMLALAGEELTGWFMWMFEIRLEDGTSVHAYKHQMTRRYVHLAEDGRAFAYVGERGYQEVDPRGALAAAVARRPGQRSSDR
ncbi:MAG TPA: hypothetical protein VIL49_12160 [Capillimicrobium sp.]